LPHRADSGESGTPPRALTIPLPLPDRLAKLKGAKTTMAPHLRSTHDTISDARLAENIADAAAAGTISIATVARAEPQILATIGALERREAELATPSALHGFITPGANVARGWHGAPMSTRREIARLLTPDMLGELRVTPRPQGWPGRRHVPAAARVIWRTV
jgi:hypothetical protein